jgi:squalene-hopene/tetraprenyl-beta-curcumene cyclase
LLCDHCETVPKKIKFKVKKISTTSIQPANSSQRYDRAYEHVVSTLAQSRLQAGHWLGELSASALSTATAISALSFYLDSAEVAANEISGGERETIKAQIDQGFGWLVGQQNSDGGFGDTSKNYSNISTTMLVVAATEAAGRTEAHGEMVAAAKKYIDSQGAIPGLKKRYGKDKTFAVPILANCAMAGIVPWSEVSALPFEAACVPQRFYHLMQLPVVSYAIPALVAIGQAKFHFDPPWDPIRNTIRRSAIDRSLRVLEKMQPASGGYLEAVPLTSFVSMGLIKTGNSNHPVVKNGIRFILDSFRSEPSDDKGQAAGSWPIDTNLATWSTTLSINSLANCQDDLKQMVAKDLATWESCLDWILSCQNTSVHPFTGAAPGGWGWTDLPGAVPDADDTPGAMLALKNLLATGCFEHRREEILVAAKNGVRWLLGLQNRDRGWPTFCRGWGKLPFDRSGADITAHVIRGLLAWREEATSGAQSTCTLKKLDAAIDRGFKYLQKMQAEDGSWNPLWFGNQDHEGEENPCYGTAKVLAAYRDARMYDIKGPANKRFNTQAEQFGLDWLVQNQNSDGGWGGGPSVSWPDESLGQSSVEETALCCEALLAAGQEANQQSGQSAEAYRLAASRGIEWLVRSHQAGCIATSSPIGFYFAKLWYYEKSYPVIFATAALAAAKSTDR